MHPPPVRALTLAVALLATGAAGCETFVAQSCDLSAEAKPPVRYTGGTTTQGGGTFIYTSTPSDGELLFFPGGMHYALVTGLPCAPQLWQATLSFDRYGTDGGSQGAAAGNEAVLLGFDRATKTLEIASDSCVDFWLQVTAIVQQSACTP